MKPELFFHIAALICWLLAAASVSSGRINLVALGLFLWFISSVVTL